MALLYTSKNAEMRSIRGLDFQSLVIFEPNGSDISPIQHPLGRQKSLSSSAIMQPDRFSEANGSYTNFEDLNQAKAI